MKILPLFDGPGQRAAHFFRNVYLKNCNLTIAAGVVILGIMGYAHWIGKMPSVIFYLLPLGFIAGGFKFRHDALKPGNWILAVGPDRLWIKYRSYLHSSLPPEDEQIIELSYDEITSAGMLKVSEYRTKNDNSKPKLYLVLTLAKPVDMSLKKALCAEREKVKNEKLSKYFPVSIRGDNNKIIEVHVNIGDRKKIEKELHLHGVDIAEIAIESQNLVNPPKDKQKLEQQLMRLVERGEQWDAEDVAQRGLKISSSESKKYIEELNRRVWGEI